jgi:hypothetical protein
MLDLIDKTLDQMAFFIPMFVIITQLFAPDPWRNNRLGLFVGNQQQKIVRITRFVGQQAVKRVIVCQCLSLGSIMPLSSGQNETQRIPQRIHTNVDFGAEATAAATKSLFSLTAVFLKPQRHIDERERWCYPQSNSPYRHHRRSAGVSFARYPCRTSEQSVCRRYSSYHISLVTRAIVTRPGAQDPVNAVNETTAPRFIPGIYVGTLVQKLIDF